MLIPCADGFALELSWSLLKRVVGGKTIDGLSQEERKLRALHPSSKQKRQPYTLVHVPSSAALLHAGQCEVAGSLWSSAFSLTAAWKVQDL